MSDTSPKSDRSRRSTTSIHPSRSSSQDSWSSSDSRSSKKSEVEPINPRRSPRQSTSKLTRKPGKDTLRRRRRPRSGEDPGEDVIQPGRQHPPLSTIYSIDTEPFMATDQPAHPQLCEPIEPGQVQPEAIPPMPVDVIAILNQLEEQDDTEDMLSLEDPAEPPPEQPIETEVVVINQSVLTRLTSRVIERRRSYTICVLAILVAFAIAGIVVFFLIMICGFIPVCRSFIAEPGEEGGGHKRYGGGLLDLD